MALPDRPVDGAEIATDWGQTIHDYTFAPSGCHITGSAPQSCNTSINKLQLDNVVDDPGGFADIANDQIEVPTDRGGLYQVFAGAQSSGGTAGQQTRLILQLNSVTVATAVEDNTAGTSVINAIWVGVLSAGDILLIAGQRRGTGSDPNVTGGIFLYRIGSELGA